MRRRTALPLGLLVLALLLLPAPLRSQATGGADASFPGVHPGEPVEGTLSPDGPTFQYRGAFRVHRFEAEAGVRYGVDLSSPDFDAYLLLARPVGGLTEILREDDDGGGGTDARLRFSLDEAGEYLLVVQALGSGSGGRYTLRLEEREAPAASTPRDIEIDAPVQGELSDDSGTFITDWDEEIPYDLWTFEAQGGEHYLVSLESSDFDAYLEFGPMSGDALQVTDTDDDGGDGLNALLRVEIPHDGRFGIRARPHSEGAFGAYELQVLPFSPAPAIRRPIALGQSVLATFERGDAVLENGSHYHEWAYTGSQGERLRISMRSGELDSYLSFGRESAEGRFEELDYNDDAPGGGLDSLLEVTLPATGTYLIRARTFGSGQLGSYTLEVNEGS